MDAIPRCFRLVDRRLLMLRANNYELMRMLVSQSGWISKTGIFIQRPRGTEARITIFRRTAIRCRLRERHLRRSFVGLPLLRRRTGTYESFAIAALFIYRQN